MAVEHEREVILMKKQLETLTKHEADLKKAENEYHWSNVVEIEEDVNAKDRQRNKQQSNLEMLNSRLNSCDDNENKFLHKIKLVAHYQSSQTLICLFL